MVKKKFLIISFLIIIVSSLFIIIGLYLNKISQPKYVISRGIDIIKDKIDNYNKTSKDLNMKDTYEIDGKIGFELDSEFYKNDKANNIDSLEKYNLINNLNKSDTTFLIQKNQNKKMGYFELKQIIDKEDTIDAKYYIENSTKYYYLGGVLDKFVNDGSCNYFENINKDNSERDNIDYLSDFILDSIKNNLKEEYFDSKQTKEKINNVDKDVYEISIKLDNETIKDILENVLKDLKKDKKASKFLNNINPNILKTKIKDNKKILDKNEYYEITIYTTKILHKPLKYIVKHNSSDSINTYIYEGDTNKGNFYYLENDSLKFQLNITFKNNEIIANVLDDENKKIGEFKLEKNKYDTTISYTKEEDNKLVDLIYSNKYNKVVKNKSYINTKNLSFKYIENKTSILNGEITVTLNVSSTPNILVDVEDAMLKSNLTDKDKEKINNYPLNIINRLEK